MDDALPIDHLPGANHPPVDAAPDPFGAFFTHIEDLYLEAGNWSDGTEIETAAQAEEVSFLIDQLRKASQDADKARAAEKKPWDDGAKAVQLRWKPLLDQADRATTAAKATLSVWLRKLEEAKRKAAEEAALAARKAADEAAAARAAAAPTDLAALEQADAATQAAADLAQGAKRAAAEKAHATGGTRAMGLRSYWTAELIDGPLAARHFWLTRRAECEAFFTQLAQADVNRGARAVAGFAVTEERRA